MIKYIHFSILKFTLEYSSLKLIYFTNSLLTFAFSIVISMAEPKSTNVYVSVEEAKCLLG